MTSGLAGSSVLTSLIARAGYWLGENTFKKRDYDTYENTELIKLNLRLIEESDFKSNYTMVFDSDVIDSIGALYQKVDKVPYENFIKKCNDNRPWVWKDPRLWLTIRFWSNLVNLNDCRFILLNRDPLQNWISSTLRRMIQSYNYNKSYNMLVNNSIKTFFKTHNIEYLYILYEDLLLHPEETIGRLNSFLNSNLTIEDLRTVYNGQLYKKSKTYFDLLKAIMVYIKNYPQRYK